MGVSASLGRSLGVRRRHGLGVGAFAVLDQVLFAGSSFSINILLARWLPPVQYGAFALAFFLFLLLGALHTAVLTEPMLVFGASVYRGRVRAYLGRHVMLHVLVSVATAIVLAVGAGVVWLSGSTAWPALLPSCCCSGSCGGRSTSNSLPAARLRATRSTSRRRWPVSTCFTAPVTCRRRTRSS
jgi:hypothetical protein